jgi:hypothetical protein
MDLPERTSPSYLFYERTHTDEQVDAAVAAYETPYVFPGDHTTYTVLAADTGKTLYVPNLTGSCTFSLPAAAAGLAYTFAYGGVAADAQNWVIDAGSDTNFFLGGLVHLDTDANSAGDEVVTKAGDGNSNSILTVVTPDVGTMVKVVCDGTNWYLSGFVASATVPSFADQS